MPLGIWEGGAAVFIPYLCMNKATQYDSKISGFLELCDTCYNV